MPRLAGQFTRSLSTLLAVLIAAAAATAAGKAAPPTAADLEVHAQRLLASRSAPEAAPSLRVMTEAGAAAFPYLARLLDEPKLHPEVRFYVAQQALNNPAPAAVPLAARFLEGHDRDLRRRAAKSLQNRADARVADQLMAVIPRESDDTIQSLELYALGLTGHPQAPAFLARYLRPELPDVVGNGAAKGLARLGASAYAPRIVEMVSERTPDWLVQDLLDATKGALGARETTIERVLALASDARHPLRLFAVHELGGQVPSFFEPGAAARAAAIGEAAASALDDPAAMVRERAVRAVAAAASGPFGYIADPAAIARLLAMLDDPSSRVRLGTVEALASTSLRRVLTTPSLPAQPLPPFTMRMLHWPSDWLILPRLLRLLDDPEIKVRSRAAWALSLSTGYWYGYPDIRLQGEPLINATVRDEYTEVLQRMRGKTPEQFLVATVDQVVESLVAGERPEHHPQWIYGIKILAGRDFGWRRQDEPEARLEAVKRLAEWWRANRARHPAEWIVEALREGGFRNVDEQSLHVLGRWSTRPLPSEALLLETRTKEPEQTVKKVLEWWDAIRAEPRPAEP